MMLKLAAWLVIAYSVISLMGGCSDGGGGTAAAPPTLSFGADKSWVDQGKSVTLTWSSTGATKVVSSNFGATTLNGTMIVTPDASSVVHLYTISVANGNQQQVWHTVYVSAYPYSDARGTWYTTNTTYEVSDDDVIIIDKTVNPPYNVWDWKKAFPESLGWYTKINSDSTGCTYYSDSVSATFSDPGTTYYSFGLSATHTLRFGEWQLGQSANYSDTGATKQ